jgi:hypothetical protein
MVSKVCSLEGRKEWRERDEGVEEGHKDPKRR